MFISSAILSVALAGIATAVPNNLARAGGPLGGGGGGGGGVGGGSGSCNANALCCDNYGSAQQLQGLISLLGINVNALTGNLGIGCVDLDIIALLGDDSCNAQAVCCQGTTFASAQLIGLNCDPIDIL